MQDAATTFLFTDIEGSTRLWEQEAQRMRPALACHDAIVRGAVERHHGRVVKMTGDGLHAAFADALDAIVATLELQRGLADPAATGGLELRVRCGLHAGPSEGRDGDYYGSVVNRAARIMSAAHGGQMLLSQAVVESILPRLPHALSLRDLGFVRLRDLAGAERLHQLVAEGLRGDFPALRSLEATPNNLPQAVSSFVGRAREIAEVARLLARHRLVTLVGMGGLGKTRLSLHVAAESLDEYPDGVWVIELGALEEAQRVALAVAAKLGVKEEGSRPIEEALARHVRDRAMLVLLDNCEHLLEAAAAIARHLLSAGAKVRVLATSREPLRIAGESTYVISGLPVPGPLEALVPAALQGYESVQLFVDRAAAALPGFELDEGNATPIAAICHRLDGIPLAIELAAARCRSISIAQLAARLKDRFRLLTSGDPTAMPRQRTLRALIDWSYDLVAEEERTLFRRLAVFSGGWTLEAAEDVCADDGVARESVLELLSQLVEKSLVSFDERSQRYRLLETVREYALERLGECGEMARVTARHLRYFAAFAASAKPHLAGDRQHEWLSRVDAERDNILSAHETAGRMPEQAELGLRLVTTLNLYWTKRGLLELADRLVSEALTRPELNEPSLARAQGLFHAGVIRYFRGRPGEARAFLEESLAIARNIGDSKGISVVLLLLGSAATAQKDFAIAIAWLEEAVALAQAGSDKAALASALTAMAMSYRVQGRLDEAARLCEQVVGLGRETKDIEPEAAGLVNLAMVSIELGDHARALELARQVASHGDAKLPRHLILAILDLCAGFASAVADWSSAARFFGAAEAQAIETGFRRDAADEVFLAPKIERARGAMGEAAYTSAEAEGRSWPRVGALRAAREWLHAIAPPPSAASITNLGPRQDPGRTSHPCHR